MAGELDSLEAELAIITKDIFSSMIMLEVEVVPLEQYESEVSGSNISSMLGMGGDIKGSVDIHFPKNIALTITSQFLDLEIDELDEDVQDAIGELANMIAGGIKSFFASRGVHTELAIPNTIVGKGYRTHGFAGAERAKVAFSCAGGFFLTEMKYIRNS